MRNGYINDTLTSVDIQENFRVVGMVNRIYESVFYRENFKKSPLRKITEKLIKSDKNKK